MLDWKQWCKDAYRGQIDPSSAHSAAPAGAWRNPVAQHTIGIGKEDKLPLSLCCLNQSVRFSIAHTHTLFFFYLSYHHALFFGSPYFLSKQQVTLWFWGLVCGICLAVWLLLFLFIGEAIACPLGPRTLRSSASSGCSPAHTTDDDRGRAVGQEDICVVLRLLRVAEQEAVTGAQGIERGLRGSAALGLHCCWGSSRELGLLWQSIQFRETKKSLNEPSIPACF